MTTGPYLYDDDPEPLHTGNPRRRHLAIVAVLLGIALLAVGMVVALFVVRGTPEEQTQEAVRVFLAALAADDTETAHQLLCEEERARIALDEVAGEYLGDGAGTVVGAERTGTEGERRVTVEWAGGGTSAYTVISEDGARICGVTDG
jgi:hypothetical protein